jgi:hypothetical protein
MDYSIFESGQNQLSFNKTIFSIWTKSFFRENFKKYTISVESRSDTTNLGLHLYTDLGFALVKRSWFCTGHMGICRFNGRKQGNG